MSITTTTTETLKIAMSAGDSAAETFTHTTRSEFKRCKGVVAYSVKQDVADKVRFALQTSSGQPIFDEVHQDDVLGNTAVPTDFRYKTVQFETAGKQVKVIVQPIAELTEDLEFDFVFKVTTD